MNGTATETNASPYTPLRGTPDLASSTRHAPGRIASLDIVRGIAMVLMAIDHVRVYSGQPAGGPTPGIFFTRWITHFVAPAFVFLAGTAAYLHGTRLGSRGALSRYLLSRGAWLVLLEVTVIRVAWTFNLDFAHYLLAGVIWMIGWCMILMAALVHLPLVAVGTFCVAVIVGHNVMDFFTPTIGPALPQSSLAWLWQILYFGGPISLGADGPPLMVLFVIVPWIGVMAAGYAFGPVMRMPSDRRRRWCLRLGFGAIASFIVLRALDVYGDPNHWRPHPKPAAAAQASASQAPSARPPSAPGVRPNRPRAPAPLRFLGTSKYPASLLFLLMTLGPMLVAIALTEHASGPVSRMLETFGRVPFFFYLLHIPLIHAAAIAVSFIRTGAADPWLFTNHPMMNPPPPDGWTWSLPLLYAVWAVCVVLLYVACRWYADVKARKRARWLSYL